MEKADLEKALDVLEWLYEEVDASGTLREEISHVRHALYDALEET